MFDDLNICPYPGLRSFTEEESLFFKGRDADIDSITHMLQERKFLMVTGASGDGKSSIIFAGLIPNAHAGFFKAKYNNWAVAHFRPENSPVKNFARSLSPLMGGRSEETVETELRRGFSSLADLYKSSPLYLDQSAREWEQADEEERKSLKRRVRNLLVVVDQFEEFFTNQQNFHRGVPSQDAQILVNLLLETVRISLRDDLPIYVVFTMRSDFIGQCASFRGLPEFIGYSQFFVPRLKRNQLQQVIEEPASLNGNQISRRLVERLLFDLSEGIDQLPILQHTLNQIWHKAADGQEEMDLIHYAQVGGLSAADLPEEDQLVYSEWYEGLAEYKKRDLEDPGLDRVLDLHANELYEGAWEYHRQYKGAKQITRKDTKRTIALAFACLTKIDDSRAVRNLMSLEDITRIINEPHLDVVTVGQVLNYYREQGNTFIRPFITDEPESRNLSGSDVLDITHESLIRNWERLKRWANKEFEYYETYLDVKKQLDKWLESGRSRGYLLPIGPLTYFENWYRECKPNAHWINRYSGNAEDAGESLAESEETLENLRLFLKKSARQVAVTRAYIKYGTARVAALLAIIIVVLLSGFYYYDADRKQNERVLDRISESAGDMMDRRDIWRYNKGIYLLNEERVKPNGLINSLASIDSLQLKIDVAIGTYASIFLFDSDFRADVKGDLTRFIDEQLDNDLDPEDKLELVNDFLYCLVYDHYYNRSPELAEMIEQNVSRIMPLLESLIENGNVEQILHVNRGIEYILNVKQEPSGEINRLLALLSPFGESSGDQFEQLYPSNAGLVNGRIGSISHNGGYQEMAYLYAALGDYENVVRCTDILLTYNRNYWHFLTFNNGFNILGYFLKFGHFEQAERYLQYLIPQSGMSDMQFFPRLLDRTGHVKYTYNFQHFDAPNYNSGLSLLDFDAVSWIFDRYEEAALNMGDRTLSPFYLAMCYKQRGLYLAKHQSTIDGEYSRESVFGWFDQAVQAYESLPAAVLERPVEVVYRYFSNGVRSIAKPLWYYFLYPDYKFDCWYSERVIDNAFAEYVVDRDLLKDLYTSSDHLETINDWLANYYETDPFNNVYRGLDPLTSDLLSNFYGLLEEHPDFEAFDATFLDLLLANMYFSTDQPDRAFSHFENIDLNQLQVTANRWEYLNKTLVLNEMLKLAKHLALQGRHDESKRLLNAFASNNYISIAYSVLAEFVYKTRDRQEAFAYLDSALTVGEKVDESQVPFQIDYRYFLMSTMAGIGGNDLNSIAQEIYIELPPGLKDFGLGYYITGICWEGNYFNAEQAIPEDAPGGQVIQHYITIMNEEANLREIPMGWEDLAAEMNLQFKDYVVFDANF
jgi:hypothetical protein